MIFNSVQPKPNNKTTMKTIKASVATLLLGALLAPALRAGDAPRVKVEHACVRAVPPVSKETAAFMVIVNDGDQPVRLTGGSTPIAGMAMPMITTHEDHGGAMAMGMKDMDYLEVPAHGKLELKPGGDHLMLTDLKSTPKQGDKVKLTLRFEPGPFEVTVEATVTKD
jgi:copper(I)-binding protein